MRSRTYLDWPEDEGDRVHFWDRLRRNIAEEDTVSTEKQQEMTLRLERYKITSIAQASKLMLQERIMLQVFSLK